MSFNIFNSTVPDKRLKPKRPSLYTIERLDDDPAALVDAPARILTRADLSADQVTVYDRVLGWYDEHDDAKSYLTLGGLAGTGKSTLVSILAKELQQRGLAVAFAAYTGKAVRVLKGKLKEQKIRPDFCGTLHSLLYKPVMHDHLEGGLDCPVAAIDYKGPGCGKRGMIESWERRELKRDGEEATGYDMIIVDEASMVGGALWNDLLAAEVPVLAVGDHGQLPPIGRDAINLMADPDLRLEQIHRQAEGNPIIALAHFVRNGGNLRQFRPTDDRVQFVRSFPQVAHVAAEYENAAICYFNKTRVTLNEIVRAHVGRSGPLPDPGDVVVCLKNNGVLANGMRGVFGEIKHEDADEFARFKAACTFPDDKIRINGIFQYHQFGRQKTIAAFDDLPEAEKFRSWDDVGLLFDFGYALTCHKMQGSQAREVVIRYETFWKDTEDTRRRWAYTAITRAVDRLYLVM